MSETEHKAFQKIVLDCPESTIVCDAHERGMSSEYHQTEQAMENALIEELGKQGYEVITVRGKRELVSNLRRQLERLNSQRIPEFKFTDSEWNNFYLKHFQGAKNTGIENRTRLIQLGDCVVELKRDDGKICNITLFDKRRPQHNYVQVMRQFVDPEANKRYDVTILVNGLPMVQIELKRRGTKIENAFQQIHRYREEAFSDLFEFIQIFVISNGTDTKYFSNTVKHEPPGSRKKSIRFAANWAYASGKPQIRDIMDFSRTFLNKRVLLEVLTKYCVLDLAGNLKILRPYQIAAIERILCRINSSINMNLKKEEAGGYIWHTTGSGKTLTSFKAAQLALNIPTVKKVLFVVDRKDLDSQTYAEYRNFLGDAEDQTIDNTKNTNALRELLNDEVPRIIVTTIQKLRRLLNEKEALNENLKRGKIIIISDECHRSQTSTIKDLLNKNFEAKSWFGFTGTPLLKNREDGTIYDGSFITFGDKLHQYTIVNAIKDEKVLPFLIHPCYKNEIYDYEFSDHPVRIKSIVKCVIDSFNRLTINRQFNSMFAVESIPTAIKYFREFQSQQENLDEGKKPLKVAVIFSPFSPSKIDEDERINADTTTSEEDKKKALDEAMQGYNKMFGTEISDFNEYRESISEKTKKKEIDILIVVDMFLTGFDAPRLNTLWVDKNLQEHGLIQAFSRTNRIVDKSKTHGNIVCFRDLREKINEALILFSLDPEDRQAAILPGYEERIARYKRAEQTLLKYFPLEKEIVGERAEREFMEAYGEFIRSLPDVMCEEKFESDREMSIEQHQDYKSIYVDLINKYRNKSNSEGAEDPSQMEIPVFEHELLRADEIYIDLDYIQNLIDQYKMSRNIGVEQEEKMRRKIMRVVGSSTLFSREKEIVEKYLNFIDEGGDLDYQEYKKQEFAKAIEQLIIDEGLQPEGAKEYIDKFVEAKEINFSGPKIQNRIMPKMNKVDKHKEYLEIWSRVKNRIEAIFEKFNVRNYW